MIFHKVLIIFVNMKKIITILSIIAMSNLAMAQNESEVVTGPYEPVASEVTQVKNTDDDPMMAAKRPTYNFNSMGLGIAVWHNWKDSDLNPKRDWDQGVTFHYARIWEMTTHGAITWINNANFTYESAFQWHETALIGGRYFFADKVISPYAGAGLGVGFEFDWHYDDFDEAFAIGPAAGLEAGVIFFRTSTTQLELGMAYDIMLDGLEFSHNFGSFTFYLAINY